MKFIDMHCDTLMWAYFEGQKDICQTPVMLDIKRMKSAGQLAQFFAIFMWSPEVKEHTGHEKPNDEEYIDTCIQIFHNSISLAGGTIAPAYNFTDIIENEKNGKMSGLLTLEDGRAINGKMDNLKKYYDAGIRLISLTWNHVNCFGTPNSSASEIMKQGLSTFGKEALEYMNDLGIIIDVSHLSDGSFMDVATLSRKPFVASHSNCRALSPHQRNLTDDMIKLLANKGGVSGINFAPAFLNQDTTHNDSTVELMVKHINHFVNVGGIECVCLGSDFDGIEGTLEVSSPEKISLIWDALSKAGYHDAQIEKIAYQNALRIIKDTL